tara:strand:+ start:929 stop:1234 length:306 start_codon:yes stop_codon:yes gene_type:complete
MKNNIEEAIYDISVTIYKDINKCEYDKKYNKTITIDIVNYYIDNYINNMTKYDLNKILLEYGIDNAVYEYSIHKDLNEISTHNFSKNLVKNLVMNSYEIAI